LQLEYQPGEDYFIYLESAACIHCSLFAFPKCFLADTAGVASVRWSGHRWALCGANLSRFLGRPSAERSSADCIQPLWLRAVSVSESASLGWCLLRSTSTGSPFSIVGLYIHCWTASVADRINSVGPLTGVIREMWPSLPTTISSLTVPSIFFCFASGGYTGETKRMRFAS
jgi:hypothetical protein